MSRLPYDDDEQNLDQDTLDLINGGDLEESNEEDDFKNTAALK